MIMVGDEERTDLRQYRTLSELGAQEQSGLREYGLVLWRKKATIVIVTAIVVGLVLAYCVIKTPTYSATASVLIEPDISQTLVEANFPTSTAALPDVPDAMQVIESSSVSGIVARTIPNPPSVTAAEVGTTAVVQVTAKSSSAQTAAAAANAYAHAYIKYEQTQTTNTFVAAENQLQSKVDTVELTISNLNTAIRTAPAGTNLAPEETQLGTLEQELTNLQDQLQNYQFYASQGTTTEAGQVISPATVPTKPSSPKTLEDTVFALIFGIILGIGIALLVNAVSVRRD
jgi:uncharacterized protein involved in exopolysaccharide biosynthesis